MVMQIKNLSYTTDPVGIVIKLVAKSLFNLFPVS